MIVVDEEVSWSWLLGDWIFMHSVGVLSLFFRVPDTMSLFSQALFARYPDVKRTDSNIIRVFVSHYASHCKDQNNQVKPRFNAGLLAHIP